jgi:AcrR family transcriptional regulator
MSNQKRKYVKKQRAAKQDETRRRIAAATAELHASVGPARTTVAEIAKRAGVQRPTVYNNFASDKELFAACQAHFMSDSPPPVLDPADGVEEVLRRLYEWWRRNQAMSGNVDRDRGAVPALDELMRETADAQFDALADALAGRLGGGAADPGDPGAAPWRDQSAANAHRGRGSEARAIIRLALRFATWKSLAADGLSDAAAAHAMATAAETASLRGWLPR